MRIYALLTLLGLLVGCTNAPLRVSLGDFDVDVALFQNNKVLFVKQSFDRPPLSLTQVALEGYLNYRQQNVALAFYAADSEPCTPTLVGSGQIYLCDPAGSDLLGSVSFASGARQRFEFSSPKLTSGINSGNLWLGVKQQSSLLTVGTLEFRTLVARVAVLP